MAWYSQGYVLICYKVLTTPPRRKDDKATTMTVKVSGTIEIMVQNNVKANFTEPKQIYLQDSSINNLIFE